MRYSAIVIMLVLFLTGCGSESFIIEEERTVLTDVLTLELTFGAENLPDEFLLVEPKFLPIMAAENGDIIVSDESRLKIFDSNGNPKKILGRPGQGPGDFDRFFNTSITSTGYITVVNMGKTQGSYNLFSPDYSLVERKSLFGSQLENELRKNYDWSEFYYQDIYSYSPKEQVFLIDARKIINENRILYDAYIYYKNDSIMSTLLLYNEQTGLSEDGFLHSTYSDGTMKVVYSNTGRHRFVKDKRHYYTIYVYDLKSETQIEISREYTPVAIPDSVIYRTRVYPDNYPEKFIKEDKEKDKIRVKKLKKLKVYAPLQLIKTDGKFIFAFTYEYIKGKGTIVDIFDSEKGEYISSSYFPFKPSLIKNGYAYEPGINEEGFTVVEKYKVNPAVYGK